MKTNYKNWMPKGLVYSMCVGAGVLWILFLFLGAGNMFNNATAQKWLFGVLLVLSVLVTLVAVWMIFMYRSFSYNGKRQMSRQIIEGIADYVKLPKGGTILDIGCGSGALTIAVARRNPGAAVTGLDRWGREYASFSQELCEANARAEQVSNTTFMQGDACRLDFSDQSFDAVVSNYVYHNISGRNRQTLLLETLRVLKKGGIFAIHDIFSPGKYGDMAAFVEQLKRDGYTQVELIDTTNGKFMNRWESLWMALSGSALLVGRK